jgi:serine/threonine protein kinase
LDHVHKNGIKHRDLKPTNVFASTDYGLQFRRLLLDYQENDDDPSNRDDTYFRRHRPVWNDPLTTGVGTASYAAPEQADTTSYGSIADIFSLGLILLELLCCFSTEHERLQTFCECRYRRTSPIELKKYPVAFQTILSCTEPQPDEHPLASELLSIDLIATNHNCTFTKNTKVVRPSTLLLRNESNDGLEDSIFSNENQGLRKQSVGNESLHLKYKTELEEKDRIIASLRQENMNMMSKRTPEKCKRN